MPESAPRLFVKRRQQIKRDVRRLKVFGIGVRDVVAQDFRARSRAERCPGSFPAARAPRSVPQSGPWQSTPHSPQRPRSVPQRRSAGHSSVAASGVSSAGELMYVLRCIWPKRRNSAFFEPRNHAEHARLIAEAHVILKSDQVIAVGALVLLPQLHDRIRPAAGSRIGQTRPLSSVRSAASRVRAARSLQSADSLRKTAFYPLAICGS